jgi:hypothetical protein
MLRPLRLACHTSLYFILPQVIAAHPVCHQDNFNLRWFRISARYQRNDDLDPTDSLQARRIERPNDLWLIRAKSYKTDDVDCSSQNFR